MRRIRKRVISKRPPYKVGFGITFSVFLALCGLMLFERILLTTTLVGISYSPATDMIIFLYGVDDTIGPLEWMALALAGLLFAQAFRFVQAWRQRETSWAGIAFGACNVGMIAMLASILAINWAFYNPLSPGAHTINGLSTLLRFDFVHGMEDIERPRVLGWEQIDGVTFCHAGAGIIEREEVIKPSFPIAHQRANFRARNPNEMEFFRDTTKTAKHYYDLDWNLLTIHAPNNWPTVREKLEAADKEPYEHDDEIWSYLEGLYHAPPDTPLPSCEGRITGTAPPLTYQPYQAVNSD